MRRAGAELRRSKDGAVAPTVALSLFALIASGGVAFDYARLMTMDTELQQAADQAALAAATQLDRSTGAVNRATAAAKSMFLNASLMANDSATSGRNVLIPTVVFYAAKADAEAANGLACPTTNAVTDDASAKFVCVRTANRVANYALTPIVAAVSSGNMSAMAVAGVGSAICKVPPVMLCNPDEPAANSNTLLAFNPTRGVGLHLVTGNASVPGNFGWLEAAIGQGATALAAELGYNVPLGDCQPTDGVTTKTGMDAAVLKAFNTRFDVFANGNSVCPGQFGGTCSPAMNTRKDLVCDPNATQTGCKNDTWNEAASPYRLPIKTTTTSTTTIQQQCTGHGKNQVCVRCTGDDDDDDHGAG